MLSIVHRQPLVSSLWRKHLEDLHVVISVFNVLWVYSVMLLRVLFSRHQPDRVSSCKACVKCFSLHWPSSCYVKHHNVYVQGHTSDGVTDVQIRRSQQWYQGLAGWLCSTEINKCLYIQFFWEFTWFRLANIYWCFKWFYWHTLQLQQFNLFGLLYPEDQGTIILRNVSNPLHWHAVTS
jgi:hypothetical protein